MTFCEVCSLPVSAAETAAIRTTILTVYSPFEAVFGYLADIENLPRWAGGFCERLYLMRGEWVALTSLGELFVRIDGTSHDGEIALLAGRTPGELHRLPILITRGPEGDTRIKFSLDGAAEE